MINPLAFRQPLSAMALSGSDHRMITSFASEADRDTYLSQPDQQEFIARSKPRRDGVLVVDYFEV